MHDIQACMLACAYLLPCRYVRQYVEIGIAQITDKFMNNAFLIKTKEVDISQGFGLLI